MVSKGRASHLGSTMIIGGMWGVSEAIMGMYLRGCAQSVSGSVMTGVALFFIAVAWASAERVLGVALLVFVASLFKLFDAALLSLPIVHGAVANPIFAFWLEGVSFVVFLRVLRVQSTQAVGRRALLGGTAALFSVSLFPLVKYATGIPACVHAGTGIPLSVYYAPVAVIISTLTVPCGFWVADRAGVLGGKLSRRERWRWGRLILQPVIFFLCLVTLVLVRLSIFN